MERKKDQKIRTFIAIKLPDKVKKELGKVERYLEARTPGTLNLVPQDQLHITVAFLGRVSSKAQQQAAEICTNIGLQFAPLTVFPTQLGAFPRPARPSVIWVGLGGDTQKLTELILEVTTQLSKNGIIPIRGHGKLIPHITLGRVKRQLRSKQTAPLRQLLNSTKLHPLNLPIPVRQLTTYRSNLSRSGPKHISITTAKLTKSSS